MQPLVNLPDEVRKRIKGVFADIDDTLTTEGKLTAQAFNAMADLQAAGFLMVPITGRPAGWCDHIARMWPVDAVVGENGAFYFLYDHAERKFRKRFMASDEERRERRRRFEDVTEDILSQVPGAALASDQPYREADLAIDYREDVAPLDDAAVDRIVGIMEAAGMTAKISSIHVNGWFGDYDKLTMTRSMMAECFDTELNSEKERYLFVGDSPNDQPMFRFFPHAVGVANINEFADRLETTPAYVTVASAGAGFAEVAGALLSTR